MRLAETKTLRTTIAVLATLAVASACGDTGQTPPTRQELIAMTTLAVKEVVAAQLEELHQAALGLQAAAPEPDADGWSPVDDAAAVEAMRAEWRKARVAYERVEGAIAVLFPDLDAATDERYDGFIAEGPDTNLFDGEGVIGVHAIERILWADQHPAHVVAFESALPGYQPAAYPANEAEAAAFRDGLLQRFVDDTRAMRDGFEGLALDPFTAYAGVIGSMEEQLEKVQLGSTGEDESRYAQHTLGDMRANLEGARAIFAAFEPLITDTEGAPELATQIESGFERIEAAYAALSGNALPAVPEGWNPDEPAAADLKTPYGQLFALLVEQSDPERETSVVGLMTALGERMNIPVP